MFGWCVLPNHALNRLASAKVCVGDPFLPYRPPIRLRVRAFGVIMRLRSFYLGLSAALIGSATTAHAQGGRGGGPETTIKPGEECPAGMTEIRPLRC